MGFEGMPRKTVATSIENEAPPEISRREFLKMSAAAAVAPTLPEQRFDAPIGPESHNTPEQERVYREGLAQLRESARTANREISRLFVTYPDGRSEWVDLETHTDMTAQTEGGSVMAMHISREAWEEGMRPLHEQEAQVEDMHTHPTRVLMGNPDRQSPLPGTDRVPPSPLDILQGLETVASLKPDEKTRYRTSVVTEAGVWRYGPRSGDAAKELVEAFKKATPMLERLKTPQYRREARELAAYLRSQASRQRENGQREVLQNIGKLIEEGSMENNLLEHGGYALDAYNTVLDFLSKLDRRFPARVREYVTLVRTAREEMVRALRTIAPDTDGMIGDAPLLADFETYISRWRSLGVDMEFEELDSATR